MRTKTDGTALATANMPGGTLLDGTTDSSTGITLIGRNFPSYGDAQNQNFVHLLENFADTVPPTTSLTALNALVGTIWYDTGTKKLRVFDGVNWNPASSTIVANTAPTSITYTLNIGDQWWDTVNSQLNAWNGSQWQLIGPDNNGFAMLETELESNVAAINANVTQLRTDTGTYMTANVGAINSTIGQLRTDTGTYMTANVSAVNSTISQLRTDTGTYMTTNVSVLNTTISRLRTDTGNYMTANVASLNTSINAVQTQLNSAVASINGNVTSGFTAANANAAATTTSLNSLTAAVQLLAPLASPTFTGTPVAPTPSPSDNSTKLATTAYVDNSASALSSDYNSKFTNEVTARNSAIATAISPLAPLANPALTGTPTAPTATAGTNTTQIATTAFVTQAVSSSAMKYTVSTGTPSGGSDGDFWFQI